ncbi:MAG TPA: MaoC family dehydratase [Nakamurella multipartita]|nr:MaoC family dehydratase [Nakamurella multipartita]
MSTAAKSVTMAELATLAGSRLGTSAPHEVSQHRIRTFADATEDHQWIHVDPARASTGPFAGTIAHGYLTLALGTALLWEVLEVTDSVRVINYGLDKVRFPSPVPSGSAVEMAVDLVSVEEFTGGLALHMVWTFQIPRSPKPACVAEAIFRYYGVLENGPVGVDSAVRRSAGHKPPA